MAARLIILQGGEDVNRRTNRSMFESVVRLCRTGCVLVIPWTSNSVEKESIYSGILEGYFHDVGFKKISVLGRGDSQSEIDSKFKEADAVYLPGGDPSILKSGIESRSVQRRLLDFEGVIIGNSAGAIVLARGGYGDGKFYDGFGIVDLFVDVHSKLNTMGSANSRVIPLVGIPEDAWISVSPSNTRDSGQ